MAALEWIWSVVRENWELALLVATWVGIAALGLRKRRDWKRKRFTQQVNFSLNEVVGGTLYLRTLLEDSAERVWLNDYGVAQVRKAAERTRVDQPFLRLASAGDMDYVKRAVLNVLSERFSAVFVARALGATVRTGTFLFGITWERYGNIRTQKLRVIIMEEAQLEGLFAAGVTPPRVVSPLHRDRLTTLEKMWELVHARREKRRRMIGRVELGVVIAGAVEPEPEWASVERVIVRDEPVPALSAAQELGEIALDGERAEADGDAPVVPASPGGVDAQRGD